MKASYWMASVLLLIPLLAYADTDSWQAHMQAGAQDTSSPWPEQRAQAVPEFKAAVHEAERAFIADDPRLADSLDALGECYLHLGGYEIPYPSADDPWGTYAGIILFPRARACFERAQSIRARVYGKNSARYAVSLFRLGELADAKGYANTSPGLPSFQQALTIAEKAPKEEAEERAKLILQLSGHIGPQDLPQQALAILEQAYGADSPKLLDALIAEAWYSRWHQQQTQGEACLTRALHIAEKAYGADSTQLSETLYNVSQWYPEQADAYYQRALANAEKAYGAEDLRMLPALHAQEERYRPWSNYDDPNGDPVADARSAKAAPYFQRAVRLLETAYGKDSMKLLPELRGYAECIAGDARWDLLDRMMQIAEDNYGKDDPRLLDTLYWYAELAVREDPSKATQLYQRAVRIAEHAAGPHDLRLAAALRRQGDCARRVGALDHAAAYYARALRILTSAKNADPDDVLALYAQMIKNQLIISARGRSGDAPQILPEALLRQRLLFARKAFGKQSDEYIFTLLDTGDRYSFWMHSPGAKVESMLLTAMNLAKSSDGPDSSQVGAVLDRLFELCRALHTPEDIDFINRLAEESRRYWGKDNACLKSYEENLALAYDGKKQYAEATRHFQRALAFHFSAGFTPENVLAEFAKTAGAMQQYAPVEQAYLEAITRLEQDAAKTPPVEPPANAMTVPYRPAQALRYVLQGLDALYLQQGKYAAAAAVLTRELHDAKPPLDDQGEYLILLRLYRCELELGQTAAADATLDRLSACAQRAGVASCNVYPPGNLPALAADFAQHGKPAWAERCYLREAQIEEAAYGAGSPNTEKSLVNLASFYARQRKNDQAVAYFQRIQAMEEAQFTRTTPRNEGIGEIDGMPALLDFYLTHGQASAAEALARRHLAAREKLEGPKPLQQEGVLLQLADVLTVEKKYREAEGICLTVIAASPEHDDTPLEITRADAELSLAKCYAAWGKRTLAETNFRKALADKDTEYGGDLQIEDRVLPRYLQPYADFLRAQGRERAAKKLEARITACANP